MTANARVRVLLADYGKRHRGVGLSGQRSRTLVAGVLILLGVLFLIDNLNILRLDTGDLIGTWWPLAIVFLGVVQLLSGRGTSPIGPLILIGIGAFLQLLTLDWVGWGVIWPLIIIGVGLTVLFQGRTRRWPSVTNSEEGSIEVSAIFGGAQRRVTSDDFHGGKLSAVFGGVELDLRDAHLATDATIEANVLFGGIEIKVPDEWNVDIQGSPLFGGTEDSRRHRTEQENGPTPTLRVKTSIIFGGLEIK